MTLDDVKWRFIATQKGRLYTEQMRITPIKAFGARLKGAIDAAGVSQADLAREYGVTPQAIYGWTVSKKPPDLAIERWVSLSRKLDVNLEWLALGIGSKERADMKPAVFEMVRQFQQLEPAQQQVIMTTISTLLLQKSELPFEAGKRP
jgi:transcriptional regulator with XRE-family HTH domain